MKNELIIQVVNTFTNLDILKLQDFLKSRFKDKILFQEIHLIVLTEYKSELVLPLKNNVSLDIDEIVAIKEFKFVFSLHISI